jgi:hypothetical protein
MGYGDDEIVKYLSHMRVDLAREIDEGQANGYTSREIIEYLTTHAAPRKGRNTNRQ